MSLVFLGLVALSLLVALASRRGHAHQRAEDFFVASGRFGTVLFFFLAVGETYSVATILGFPGGVYAHGASFVSWFLGYILLAFPVGYFLNPWIWRAGRLHGAITLPDLFRRHFDSRALELVVTLASILFLVPLGMMQFMGLATVLRGLGWSLPPLLLTGLGGALAFLYIALSGIRAPAYVAVLKDLLMMAAILVTGLAALAAWHRVAPGHAARACQASPATPVAVPWAGVPSWRADLFAMSTIVLQGLGFAMVPQTCAYVFTARDARTVRRGQMLMPLYMVMFPFLVAVPAYALAHGLHPASASDVFLDTARSLLPGWAVGVVTAGAALSALVVLTGICLALGPLVVRNLVPGLDGPAQQRLAKLVMALYLVLSLAGAARSAQLLVAINNLFYFGVTQSLPGILAMLFLRRVGPGAIVCGLLCGDAVALGLHLSGWQAGGVNPGFVGLLANAAIMLGAARLWPDAGREPVAARWLLRCDAEEPRPAT